MRGLYSSGLGPSIRLRWRYGVTSPHPTSHALHGCQVYRNFPGFFHGLRLPDPGFWLTLGAAGKSSQFNTSAVTIGKFTMELLLWIEETSLGVHVREDAWTFAIMLCLHSVGMAASLGVVMITTLRSVGALKGIPVLAHAGLFPAAWIGFGINLISGLALYVSHATEYTFQVVFILKLSLLAVGGVFMKLMMNNYRAGGVEMTSKLFGGLTLVCWIGAIITGRLMAYS
jgi:hypothetical protein